MHNQINKTQEWWPVPLRIFPVFEAWYTEYQINKLEKDDHYRYVYLQYSRGGYTLIKSMNQDD